MLRLATRCAPANSLHGVPHRTFRLSSTAAKQHDPLRILFCGADEFSIYSLRALHALRTRRPEKIASINVVCRPDKRGGRGMKQVHEVPVKAVANGLDLNLHQIDTFRNWAPPMPIDLVVAVSFGLLVPARILNGATYGGLNVHPSLLPDLRGPAPMIHTLLKRRKHTGVTLQTMHPTKFDHGAILARSPYPGIPVPEDCTADHLLKLLGPCGAQLLCDGIEQGLFLPPVKDIGPATTSPPAAEHAPKITAEDRHIDWCRWSSEEIQLRDRVCGRLWDLKTYSSVTQEQEPKRIVFHGPWQTVSRESLGTGHLGAVETGSPVIIPAELLKTKQEGQANDKAFGVVTGDDQVVIPLAATIDGGKKGTGLPTLVKRMLAGRQVSDADR